ncbi:MAG TPA: DUF5818 domain-containing protein [Pyrinomonadaceae bacterium]|nr:DUF5818 domain-containing protein [Pyrinomonadaceae bacterium]
MRAPPAAPRLLRHRRPRNRERISDKNCTLACLKQGGKLVLADRDHKRVYRLDQTGQEKARDFTGQKVKVTGTLSGRTIRVTAVEAAS